MHRIIKGNKMTITEAKRKFIIYLTLMIVVLGFGGAAAFNQWMPENYPPFYPSIPIFFYVYGLFFIYIYGLFPDKRLEIQILGKGVKLIFGLLFVVAYAHFIGVHVKAFLITFLCYYIIYLIFESGFFLNHEMEMKKENKK